MEKNNKSASRIVPVILAGGSGSRLWPLSRASQPKQFLPLMEDDSLLIATCRRFAAPSLYDRPVIICNSEHHDLVAKQLRHAGIVPKAIILEPLARGTAAAAALAALFVERENPGSAVLLLAADNHLQRPAAFLEGVALGARAADIGQIVLFGVAPTRAESGFGYIETGEPVDAVPGVWRVRAFVEKPSRDQAETLLNRGGHLWNSGNFLFRTDILLGEFNRLRPDILAACRTALDRANPFANGLQPERSSLAGLRAEVIDRAILERTDRAAVVTIDAGWSDVGTWESVWNASAKDTEGNSLTGDVVIDGVKGCYIRSESRLVVAVGLTDLE
jgi:mannose-1-phosphate guanylyltransferase/mannose-6-phosphate isomerase